MQRRAVRTLDGTFVKNFGCFKVCTMHSAEMAYFLKMQIQIVEFLSKKNQTSLLSLEQGAQRDSQRRIRKYLLLWTSNVIRQLVQDCKHCRLNNFGHDLHFNHYLIIPKFATHFLYLVVFEFIELLDQETYKVFFPISTDLQKKLRKFYLRCKYFLVWTRPRLQQRCLV